MKKKAKEKKEEEKKRLEERSKRLYKQLQQQRKQAQAQAAMTSVETRERESSSDSSPEEGDPACEEEAGPSRGRRPQQVFGYAGQTQGWPPQQPQWLPAGRPMSGAKFLQPWNLFTNWQQPPFQAPPLQRGGWVWQKAEPTGKKPKKTSQPIHEEEEEDTEDEEEEQEDKKKKKKDKDKHWEKETERQMIKRHRKYE